MQPKTFEETYQRWMKTVETCHGCGWYHQVVNDMNRWIFKSPSGTLHDLSAADLTKLDEIEDRGLFPYEAS
jgi:hypothetical protein